MSRQRLRPAHTDAELARIYAKPHNHTQWTDHRLRVDVTVQVGKWLAGTFRAIIGADLSCGDSAILNGIPLATRIRGDYAAGYQHTGPLERTVGEIPPVDLFVCAETLEHLDDPDTALKSIREKTRLLLLSTPVEAWTDDNEEHYWAWSRGDVEEMLAGAEFKPVVFNELDFRPAGLPYSFGIWGAK